MLSKGGKSHRGLKTKYSKARWNAWWKRSKSVFLSISCTRLITISTTFLKLALPSGQFSVLRLVLLSNEKNNSIGEAE